MASVFSRLMRIMSSTASGSYCSCGNRKDGTGGDTGGGSRRQHRGLDADASACSRPHPPSPLQTLKRPRAAAQRACSAADSEVSMKDRIGANRPRYALSSPHMSCGWVRVGKEAGEARACGGGNAPYAAGPPPCGAPTPTRTALAGPAWQNRYSCAAVSISRRASERNSTWGAEGEHAEHAGPVVHRHRQRQRRQATQAAGCNAAAGASPSVSSCTLLPPPAAPQT